MKGFLHRDEPGERKIGSCSACDEMGPLFFLPPLAKPYCYDCHREKARGHIPKGIIHFCGGSTGPRGPDDDGAGSWGNTVRTSEGG